MRRINYQGIQGFQFDDFKEAWMHYLDMEYGGTAQSAEMYHATYKAFLSGANAGINIASVKYNDLANTDMDPNARVAQAFVATLKDAMACINEESKRIKGGQ